MATISIPKRVCDRCGDTVPPNFERVALCSNTPDKVNTFGHETMRGPEMDIALGLSLDLCRGCERSLRLWTTAVGRRAAAKEGASQ